MIHRPPPRVAALCRTRALARFSEFIDKFPRFLHPLFVKRRTNQDCFLLHARMFLYSLLRQEERQRHVRLDLFLEKSDCPSFRFVHRCPPACHSRPEIENIRKGESRPRSTVESLVLAQAQSRQILNLPTTIRVNRICMRGMLFCLSVFAARHFYTVPTNCFVLCLVRRTCSIASIQRGAGLYRSK